MAVPSTPGSPPSSDPSTPLSKVNISSLGKSYRQAEPFRHIVIDDFAPADDLRQIVAEDFTDVGSPRWTYHRYYSQKTYSRTDRQTFGSAARRVIDRLWSSDFLRELEALTGHTGLLCDDQLEDGGLHATGPGGYLNVHVDALVHPTKPTWQRAVNLILYLDENWAPEYGGELELWNADMTTCMERVAPAFNRCVLFDVGANSLHGFPDVLRCPPGAARKCLALYYFIDRGFAPPRHFGRLYARPGDGAGRLWVQLDNTLLHLYGRFGQKLGFDDQAINRMMRWVGVGRQQRR